MSLSSGIIDIKGEMSSDVSVIGVLYEGPVFRTYKVKQGTKFVVFKTTVVQDSMRMEMLRREYEIGRILSHPCIVSMLGFLEKSPVGAAIVMEYIEGVSLDRYLRRNLSPAQRRAILSDILDGVDYLHHRGVIHNDLKPSNIIVTGTGAARIIDFGLSLSDDSAYRGAVGGTEGFSAPELSQGISSPASDVYSIGKLIEAIYGRKRFHDVVTHATAPDASMRYRNIGDIRVALKRSRVKRMLIPLSIFALSVWCLLFAGSYIHRFYMNRPVPALSVEEYMDSLYRSTVEKASAQPYQEFAYCVMGEYLHQCSMYGDSLPEERKKIISIYHSHQQSLEEIMYSKPSINTLPDLEQVEMMNRLLNGEVF